jgi:hypothetical protein
MTQEITPRPAPGEDWKTARGFKVRIDASTNQDIIQAHFLDLLAGGHLPVQFALFGKKIGGMREDWLTERLP